MEFNLHVQGGPELQRKLDKIAAGVIDLGSVMKTVGKFLVGFYTDEVFLSQGGIYGSRWPDLKASTIKQKEKANLGAGISPRSILQRTGQMRHSFKLMTASTYCRITNTSDHFAFPQLGTRNMPQRTIMALDQARREAVTKMIEVDLDKKLQAL